MGAQGRLGVRAGVRLTQQGQERRLKTPATNGSTGSITEWTRQNGPVGPFAGRSVHTDSTRPTTLARQPRRQGSPSCRRSSERSILTVCSNAKSGLGVRRIPEPRTSPASPICRLGREQRVRDDLAPCTWTTSSSVLRMRPDPSRRTRTYRSATHRPSGLQSACRRPAAGGVETWRGEVHRTDVGRCRPTTGQCRDFTLNRSADWTQLT